MYDRGIVYPAKRDNKRKQNLIAETTTIGSIKFCLRLLPHIVGQTIYCFINIYVHIYTY